VTLLIFRNKFLFLYQNFLYVLFLFVMINNKVFYNPPGSLPTNGFPLPAVGVGGPSPGVAPPPPA
jgi:hypothetical protein